MGCNVSVIPRPKLHTFDPLRPLQTQIPRLVLPEYPSILTISPRYRILGAGGIPGANFSHELKARPIISYRGGASSSLRGGLF
jgi:hypothetical protein